MAKENTHKDLITATREGDRRETLEALRDLLAERVQNAKSDRDVASMSRRLMQCISEIEEIDRKRESEKAENPISDMQARVFGKHF